MKTIQKVHAGSSSALSSTPRLIRFHTFFELRTNAAVLFEFTLWSSSMPTKLFVLNLCRFEFHLTFECTLYSSSALYFRSRLIRDPRQRSYLFKIHAGSSSALFFECPALFDFTLYSSSRFNWVSPYIWVHALFKFSVLFSFTSYSRSTPTKLLI